MFVKCIHVPHMHSCKLLVETNVAVKERCTDIKVTKFLLKTKFAIISRVLATLFFAYASVLNGLALWWKTYSPYYKDITY